MPKQRHILAIKKYSSGEASLGKAAELAGLSINEMIELLSEFGVKAPITYEDYLKGLENIRKVW